MNIYCSVGFICLTSLVLNEGWDDRTTRPNKARLQAIAAIIYICWVQYTIIYTFANYWHSNSHWHSDLT